MKPGPVAPVLVFGWGNPSRGDDALGPILVEQLVALPTTRPGSVDYLTDFQLQVEHALDLAGRQRVLFVDASLNCAAPFEVTALMATRDMSFTTHAMSPQAVMQVFRNLYGIEAPPCTLLAIHGERFELGEPPSDAARANLTRAVRWCRRWLASEPTFEALPISTGEAHA
jgi:hydrogenase maturation protease